MSTKHRRKPYMPDSDRGKKNWMERFITQLESDPQRYGFNDPRMFEYYQRTIRGFITAYDAASSPATRTPSAVRTKNQARKKAVSLCRDFAMQLKWDTSLTDAEKRSLGIIADELPSERAKLPDSMVSRSTGHPELVVASSPTGGHIIRYREPLTQSKAKPKGVSHLLLFGAIGVKPNMRKTHARFMSAYSKRPFEIQYPIECGLEGMYVTYYGRWLTTRGEMSPWSLGVSKIIGGTQVLLRESAFAHLFGKEGFVDALPALAQSTERGLMQGITQVIEDDSPLLERGMSEDSACDGLFAALEATTVRLLNAE